VKDNSADTLALIAILVGIISGGFNLHLMADNRRLQTDNAQMLTEYRGFKDGCAYSR
jgi:hypothetical protein